jgi:hypothetical protein
MELPPTNVLGSAKTLSSCVLVYGRPGHHGGHGGIVVVAPMGTKPLLGGSKSSVPAGTLSGFLMLLRATKAGAERLKRSAMRYKVSPDCTVYFCGAPVVVGAPDVVDWARLVLVEAAL